MRKLVHSNGTQQIRVENLTFCVYPPRSVMGQSEPGRSHMHRVFWDSQKPGDPPVSSSLTGSWRPASRAHAGSQCHRQPHGQQYMGGLHSEPPKTNAWCNTVNNLLFLVKRWDLLLLQLRFSDYSAGCCFSGPVQRGAGVVDQSKVWAETVCGAVASSHTWRGPRHHSIRPSSVGSDGAQSAQAAAPPGPLHEGGH